LKGSKNITKMEIQELIFFYLHENTDLIEVQFRFTIDSDDEIRTDFINLNESDDFGYNLIYEDYNLTNEEDDEDDMYWLESPSIDEDILLSFLNEYYIINPDKMPKPELI
jgi:hypothetical protein